MSIPISITQIRHLQRQEPAKRLGIFDREAQTKDAAFAVSSGIIHEIKDVQLPAGGPVISLVFQR